MDKEILIKILKEVKRTAIINENYRGEAENILKELEDKQ